ncbi:hypothetical protein [Brevundimonas sp. A19_0]|uniref:hypothetical protein n=1 Tax=Brevundimonas sp. A19_0 TaxID=2821087 RepID=UPI001ADBF396|nr:hypothetical protein [Brevundimonas sp. A19_0]MBO9501640.1 hypothetical protein [Brevundimonas sp. A19_0]
MWRLELPDFAFADDATIERTLPSLDGRWSAQTRGLLAQAGTTLLELNASWASTPVDWFCPVCLRRKPQIARLTSAGVLLCQLDRHHDHLDEEGAAILFRSQVKHADRARRDAVGSAVLACRALAERFHPTLVCNDCNAADGAAKAALEGVVHPQFSFAPSEIARFIRVAPNRAHEIDDDVARTIWTEVAEDVADRLAFMEIMARRIADGRHVREGSSYPPHPLAAVTNDLLENAGLPFRGEGLLAAIHARSIQRDGFGSSTRNAARKPTTVPTLDDLARFTAARPPNDDWHGPGEDWRCETCERSRFEMLRKSPKSRLWTAGAHRRRIFAIEARQDALRRRNGWYEDGLTYGDHRWVWICKDCRQIVTDTKQTGQHLIDDCLSIQDIRSLLISVTPHERPEFDRQEAAQRAKRNFEIMAAIDDYDRHRQRCLNLFYRRRQLLRFHREPDVDEAQLEEIWEEHIEADQRRHQLAWLLDEGRRYSEANARDWSPEGYPKPDTVTQR